MKSSGSCSTKVRRSARGRFSSANAVFALVASAVAASAFSACTRAGGDEPGPRAEPASSEAPPGSEQPEEGRQQTLEAPPHCAEIEPEQCAETAISDLERTDSARAPIAEALTYACSADVASACFELGRMHRMGRGIEVDDALALRYYERACTLGVGDGCQTAGLAVVRVADEERGAADARALFSAGCELDSASSCLSAGRMMRDATGGERDSVSAVAAFDKGCTLGDREACADFGRMLLAGNGIEPDLVRGATALSGACNASDFEACAEYAELLRDGVGVESNAALAVELATAACRAGVTAACSFELVDTEP